MKRIIAFIVAGIVFNAFGGTYQIDVINNLGDDSKFISVGRETIEHFSEQVGDSLEEHISFEYLDLRKRPRFGKSPLANIKRGATLLLDDSHFKTRYLYFTSDTKNSIFKSRTIVISLCKDTPYLPIAGEVIVVDAEMEENAQKSFCIKEEDRLSIIFEY